MIDSISHDTLKTIGRLEPLWSMNEREAKIMAERFTPDPGPDFNPRQIAANLSEQLGKIIVRVGAEGTWFGEGGTVQHIPTIKVRPVDSNGAGDAHSGVLCACIAKGMDLESALRWANIAGALSTTKIGPATCPTAAEIANNVARAA